MARPTSPLAALRRMFNRTSRPIYALDAKRVLVFANQAFAEWAGAPLDSLIGLQCAPVPCVDFQTALAAGLSPPPEALLEGRRSTTVQAPAGMGAPAIAESSPHVATLEPADAEQPPTDPFPVWSKRWKQRRAELLSWQEDDQLLGTLLLLSEQDEPVDGLGASELRIEQRLARLQAAMPADGTVHLLGESALMHRVRQQVKAARISQASVLVHGPPGAGVDDVARSIARQPSGDRHGSVLPLHCALLDVDGMTAVMEDLEHSSSDPIAPPHVILLMDVDQLSLPAQGRLCERLEALRSQLPELRLLATAAEPLAGDAVHAGFVALVSEMVIGLPSLAERREDIPLLAQSVLQAANTTRNMPLMKFNDDAMDLIVAYPWFENHHELQMLLGEACDRAQGGFVTVQDLPHPFHAAHQQAAHPRREPEPIDLQSVMEQVEREIIEQALKLASGNKSQAARLLTMRRARLLRRIEALGIEQP